MGAAAGKPYVVTPKGMLEPWALRNSKWKKRFARLFYEDRTLRGAACFQANTTKELDDIRTYGLANPVAVISNGINLPADKEREKLKGARQGRSALVQSAFVSRTD